MAKRLALDFEFETISEVMRPLLVNVLLCRLTRTPFA